MTLPSSRLEASAMAWVVNASGHACCIVAASGVAATAWAAIWRASRRSAHLRAPPQQWRAPRR